jgi:hypothetical protein
MAYGIDMSKLVDDRNGINGNIPDELCNIIAWPEHLACKCPLDPKRDSKRAPAKGKAPAPVAAKKVDPKKGGA